MTTIAQKQEKLKKHEKQEAEEPRHCAHVLNVEYRTDRWARVQREWGAHFALRAVRVSMHACGGVGAMRAHRQAINALNENSGNNGNWICVMQDNVFPVAGFQTLWRRACVELRDNSRWQIALFPETTTTTTTTTSLSSAFVCYHERLVRGPHALLPALDAYIALAEHASSTHVADSGLTRAQTRVPQPTVAPFATLASFCTHQMHVRPDAFMVASESVTMRAASTSFSDSRLAFVLPSLSLPRRLPSLPLPLAPLFQTVPIATPPHVPTPMPFACPSAFSPRGSHASSIGVTRIPTAPTVPTVPPYTCALRLVGRLGNHMFQIAALLAHCIRYARSPVLIMSACESERTARYYATGQTLRRCAPFLITESQHTHEHNSAWTRSVQNAAEAVPFHYKPLHSDSTILHGYFQSARYFAAAKNDIFAFFAPSPSIVCAATRAHALLLTPDAIESTIVVHVRRGDYCTSKIHGILTPAFFKRGISDLRRALLLRGICEPRVLIFSDDPVFCEGAFPRSDTMCETICVREDCEAVALYVMSRFRHYVMSNSSFSWWAVMLGEPAQSVIAPRPWFGPTGPQDYDDVYEPSWTQAPAC
jgi:hypothetical protein